MTHDSVCPCPTCEPSRWQLRVGLAIEADDHSRNVEDTDMGKLRPA